MDKLEKFAIENKSGFDDGIPSPEIWKRIAAKGKRNKIRSKRYIHIISRVAAVIMIFILSYLFHEYRSFSGSRKKSDLVYVYNAFPELREAEMYYNQLVSSKMSEMKPFLLKNPEIAGELSLDLAELDSIYRSFQNDLMDNIANDQIIEAMIQNYRMKLDILEDLKDGLRIDSNSKNDENGSHEI